MDKRRRYLEEDLEAWGACKGDRTKVEARTTLISSPFRSPEAVNTKTDTQVTSGLRLRHSRYVQKADEDIIPMAPVVGQNSSGVDGNRPRKLTYRVSCDTVFWSLGRVSCWSPRGAHPEGLT
jgi:hypothetical protein